MPRIDTLDERLRSVESDAIKATNEPTYHDNSFQSEAYRAAEETLQQMKEMYESIGANVESLSATVRLGGTAYRSEVTMGEAAVELLFGSAESQNKRRQTEMLELWRSQVQDRHGHRKRDGRGRLQEHPSQLAIPDWLQALLELDSKGKSDVALDELFDRIDELLSGSEYEMVDSILAGMPLEGPSLTLMMGLLSITRPAAEHLPSRLRYFDRVYRLCVAMRRDAESLLRGLK